LEEGSRVVTFGNGLVVRALIVDIDDEARRLVYAAIGGRTIHHNSSMQVFADGLEKSRLAWITDILPNELAATAAQLVDQGATAMKRTLEEAAAYDSLPIRQTGETRP